MGLKHTQKESTAKKYAPGVFVDLVEIQDAIVEPAPFPNSEFGQPDLCLKVAFDIGASFTPTDLIFGNFKKAEDGQIQDWGSAFKIANFIEAVTNSKEFELTETNEIPEGTTTELIGKKVYRLTYVYGFNAETQKPKYKNWDTYGREGSDPSFLVKYFLSQAEKGYPKDYRPDIMGEDESTIPPKDLFPDENKTVGELPWG